MGLRERTAIHESGHACALTFGIPVISVTIDDRPHLYRDRYRAHDASFWLECVVTLCLAGPEAEKEFCGEIFDGSDEIDYQMAREYLARQIRNPLHAAAELAPFRDSASGWSAPRGATSGSPCSPTHCSSMALPEC